MGVFNILSSGDAVTRLVALLLLAMSVASWVVILWKSWLLQRAGRGHRQGHCGVLAIP
jgi:biopolymer transport protein ExbB